MLLLSLDIRKILAIIEPSLYHRKDDSEILRKALKLNRTLNILIYANYSSTWYGECRNVALTLEGKKLVA